MARDRTAGAVGAGRFVTVTGSPETGALNVGAGSVCGIAVAYPDGPALSLFAGAAVRPTRE
jgi:hypothetical protein